MPVKHVVAGDGLITSPWFGPPRLKPDPKLAGRPWILTFVGTEKSFVDGFFEGVASSADDYAPAAFPPILAFI